MLVKLTAAQKIKILNSDDVYTIMQKVLLRENKIDRDKEHFWIIGLANNNKALFIELVSIGSVNSTTVEPMNVFRVAILKNAVKVVLVHNHPSGELKPSKEDRNVTDRLIQVGKIINVEVIEHLIITPKSYLSFIDIGLFEELRGSTKWLPNYQLEKKIKAEERKIRKEAVKAAKEKGKKEGIKEGKKAGREEGLKEGKIQMAKSLKEKDVDISLISDASGLSIKEIEKL